MIITEKVGERGVESLVALSIPQVVQARSAEIFSRSSCRLTVWHLVCIIFNILSKLSFVDTVGDPLGVI